jgi:NAD(P)H-hydrate epimerase
VDTPAAAIAPAAVLLTEIADLLRRTGHAHHQPYLTADGVDPDWAIWYAGYLQAHLGDRLGTILSRSELVYRLLKAEKAHVASGGETPWPEFYAPILVEG